jgi:hypothetical protein
MEMEPIDKDLLDGLRSLDDEHLTKVIVHVNEFGWRNTVDVLRAMLAERRKRD